MSDDASFELLGFQVIQGEQVVTYRKLSSDLQVHAEDAKRMMAAFYEANKERCHATFLLSGTRKRDMVDESVEAEWLVKLVTESELPSQQLNLEYAEYHIYSIEPRPVEDKSVFVTANISTGNIRDMIHLGAIGSSVAMVAKTGTASIPRAPSPVRPPTSKSENKSHSTKANDESRMDEDASMAGSTTDANAPAVSKAADKVPDKTSTKAKANPAKSFFGKHIAKKSAAVTTSSEATAAPSDEITSVKAEVSTASSLEPESKPDPVPPMSDSDDHAMQSAEEEVETAVKQSRVEDMFDDFDDSDFDSFAKSASAHPDSQTGDQQQQQQHGSACRASDASQEGLESDIEMAEPTAVTNDNAHPELQNVGGGRRRVRKQRKVNRIKHTKNKRGMLVTQAVEEWESYSESESDAEPTKPKPNPKPKPSMSADEPASKKKSSAGGSKGSGAPQRSILSFFGKKN